MPTLYVTETGARLEKEYRHLLVTGPEDEALLRLPLAQVEEVVLVGSVGVTTPALLALLQQGASLSLVSPTGALLGRLQAAAARNIPLRHQQYRCAEQPAFCLELSRAIVQAKLRNQRTLARRLLRKPAPGASPTPAPISEISRALRAARAAPDLPGLRGLEGQAARAYFSILRLALPAEWRFPRRSRRPPGDPFNALLSLGYSLLTNNLITALEVCGLDPYDGFFHADKYGRPALALDLVEEFRSLIADSLALTLVNKRILSLEDFQPGSDGGVYLRPAALRRFLGQYSRRIQTRVYHPLAGRPISYQKCFEVQARQVRKVIEGQQAAYQPFLTR
jgi:CRISPR-associated protein Cas1